MTVDEFWDAVRARMKEQAHGYQAKLARELDVDRSYINRFIKGEHELAPKYQQAVLDSLGIEMDMKPKDGPQ